jgi:hypothetical protein
MLYNVQASMVAPLLPGEYEFMMFHTVYMNKSPTIDQGCWAKWPSRPMLRSRSTLISNKGDSSLSKPIPIKICKENQDVGSAEAVATPSASFHPACRATLIKGASLVRSIPPLMSAVGVGRRSIDAADVRHYQLGLRACSITAKNTC